MKSDLIPILVEVPVKEQKQFDDLVHKYREKHIRSSQQIVDLVFDENPYLFEQIKNKSISISIRDLREIGWKEFLKDEVIFNALLMKDLHNFLETPKDIIDKLIETRISEKRGNELMYSIKEVCGEYAGLVFPYIYRLSLSNTQSRRSRAGKTFEAIIYKIYECLEYPYDSQSKVGRKIFTDVGLGKKVDSILPSIESFEKRRNKTIIGTMKTSLRERWQEVAEEIERTKIPEIHLLTVDENITVSKAKEMAKHNIIVVAYDWVANSHGISQLKNIVSFEQYFFEEIPNVMSFWASDEK
jgi:hypothetical protein